ncbi:4-phosphoerythronate dehydrogenase [Paraglaciecola aestuariivivens]
MKIYYEDSMPYAAEFFAELGECQVFNHKTVNSSMLADADVLLVRSTTKVNADLIEHCQQLKWVATATAGTDHIDRAYLASRNIPFYSAGGCNAVAVAEYVLSALMVMGQRLSWQWPEKTVGIVGAGYVGTALANILGKLNIPYKLCDPPLAKSGDSRDFVELEQILQCDLISLHVPLIKDGPYATENMFDSAVLNQLNQQQVLINACRGEVLDNDAALALAKQKLGPQLVLDVWENEPKINLELLKYTALATAHIAGHTIEGKARGTEMLYSALCKFLAKPATKTLQQYLPKAKSIALDTLATQDFWQVFPELVLAVYDISEDDRHFRANMLSAEQFRYIRKHYPIRREFSSITLNTGNFSDSKALYQLGFLPAN